MQQQEFNFYPSVALGSARNLECGQAEELLMSLASPPLSLCVVLLLGQLCAERSQSAHTHIHSHNHSGHTSVNTHRERLNITAQNAQA